MDTPQQLFIAADEEVTSILERIKKHEEKELLLIVPPQAKLFQSQIHLKLLYKEAIALEKVLTIASSNEAGLTLAANTGFPTEIRKEAATKPTTKSKHKKHAPAVINEKIDSTTFMMPAPGKRVIGLFFGISAFVFILIAYFVLPTVTIRITPETKVEKPLERVTIADSSRNSAEIALSNGEMIASLPVDTEVELTKTYTTTGITSTGTNAKGIMTIHNDGDLVQLLINNTRFRSPDGYIFRIKAAINVPPKGTVTAPVEADAVDDKGQVIGSKGNLPAGVRFTLPGLQGTYKNLIYGTNDQPFTGGVTQAIRTVADQDLESANKDIVVEIQKIALTKLRERIGQENASQNKSLVLLENDKVVKNTVLQVQILENVKPKDIRDTFQAYAKVRVSTVAFDQKDIMKVLDRKLSSIINPDMRIAFVDSSNLEVQYVEQDTRAQKIKVNITMPYRLEYMFKPDFLTRLKSQISGMSIAESEKYLNSLDSIAEAKISSWPFWVNSIPGLKSNINLVIDTD